MIEFQVDTVFDSILESMAERVKYEVVDATYDETDLDFACTKADNRFQGETETIFFSNDQANTSKNTLKTQPKQDDKMNQDGPNFSKSDFSGF